MDFETVHPEKVDPIWFQELVRRAMDREVRRLTNEGRNQEEVMERAMWYVFEIRDNLTDLYQAGKYEEEDSFE